MKPLLGNVLSVTKATLSYSLKGVGFGKGCNFWPKRHLYISCKLLAGEKKVGIGNVFTDLFPSKKPEFVPCQYGKILAFIISFCCAFNLGV